MRKQLALIFAVLALGLVGCSQGSDNNAAPAQDQTAAPVAPDANAPAPVAVTPAPDATAPSATTTPDVPAPTPAAQEPAPTTQTSAMNNTMLFAENTVAQPAADKKAPVTKDADKSVGGPVDETD